MKAKTVLLFIVVLSLLFSSGCWDYTEYEHLALLSSLGVDFDNTTKQMTVSVEYIITGSTTQQGNGGGGSKNNFETIKASGSTIAEALSEIQQTTRKRLFFSYLGVVVIGEDAAKYIMTDILDFFDRTSEIRTSTYTVVTPGKAETVLSTYNSNASAASGKIIHDMIDQAINSGKAFPVTIQDLEENMAVSGKSSIAPRITIVNENKTSSGSSSSGSNSSSSGDSSSKSSGSGSPSNMTGQEPYKYLEHKNGYQIIDGIAAFNGDKFVGWLEGDECIGLGLILNKEITTYENVRVSNAEEPKKELIFNITKSNSKMEIQLEESKPEITVNTYIEADLSKTAEGFDQNMLTPDVISLMEQKLGENVKSQIRAAIDKGQKELKTDIFGFGFEFYRRYPKQWHSRYEKEWDNIFPDLPVKINVTAKVINTGTNIKTFSIK